MAVSMSVPGVLILLAVCRSLPGAHALRSRDQEPANIGPPSEHGNEEEPPYVWLNAHGEKEVDCRLPPGYGKVKLMLTSSLFDVNTEALVKFFRELPPPPGKAIWIGDATAGARPWYTPARYYSSTYMDVMLKTGYSLQYVMLHKEQQGKEAMEELLKGVGVVYLEGGDHMFLMSAIRNSSFAEALRPKFLNGEIAVIGRSAGTIDAGLDVGFSAEKQSEGLLHGDWSGMGLAGHCSLRQHFQLKEWHDKTRPLGVSELFDEEATAQFKRTAGENRLVTLYDGQALMITNGITKIVP